MDNNCYEGNILNAALNEMKNRRCCCPRYIPGPTGPTGPTGPIGLTGATGPTGVDGADGLDGETPTITIGTVTTGAPGTQAAASITGTPPDYVLNLTIPQGPTGPTA